ncbi:MAG: hypothetical protein IIA35_07375, partial [Proteobacteria bacterium]|nr:hypothetical protein [Pseudomonadota bacterium]
MKISSRAWAGLTAGVIAATPVMAAEDSKALIPGDFSANVGVFSDYTFRGTSQTGNEPALQGGIDYSIDTGANGIGLYLGTWGSNVDFADGDEASSEVDLYAGWSGALGKSKVTLDIGGIYYLYPGAADALDYDFYEIYAGLSGDFGAASANAKVSYSPDYFGGSGDGTYAELGIDVPLGKYFTLNLHVGHQWIDENATFGADDYFDYL